MKMFRFLWSVDTDTVFKNFSNKPPCLTSIQARCVVYYFYNYIPQWKKEYEEMLSYGLSKVLISFLCPYEIFEAQIKIVDFIKLLKLPSDILNSFFISETISKGKIKIQTEKNYF